MPRGQVFGKRQKRHTLIIASGERVRYFTIRPALLFVAAGVPLVFFAGYIGATAYLMMRDDMIGAAHTHQTRMIRQYEDRIAALREQVDRAKSRQLVDQRNIADNMRRLFVRQQKLSLRHGQLQPLLDRARLAGLTKTGTAVPVPMPRPNPAATNTSDGIAAIEQVTGAAPANSKPGRFASAYMSTGSIPAPDATKNENDRSDAAGPRQAVETVAKSLRRMETDQIAKVDMLTGRAVSTASAIQAVLMHSGLPGKIDTIASKNAAGRRTAAGIGGPYIRLDDPAHFEASLHTLDKALDQLENIRSAARKLPFGQPLTNDVVTSPFGARSDPFLNHVAFHPGVDLRAARGTDVHATGKGTIVFAGHDGGYGNMVEIDHGDGVHTRYGHLSKILVHKGEQVTADAIIAESGSTGRSTGPHLHYEVRLNGKPVNPIRFLDSGRTLQAYLRN